MVMLRKEDSHVMRRVLDLETEDQSEKWRPKRTWEKERKIV